MDYALSDQDISRLLKGKAKIIRYGELKHFTSVDELLKPYNRVFILYEAKKGVGHWTLLHKLDKSNLEMFDSYGLGIDDELDYLPAGYRQQSDQARAHLSQLLGHSNYTIHYNDHKLQDLKRGVSTCGRWCVARCINNKCTIDDFARRVKDACEEKGVTPDELVCELVRVGK